MVSTLLQQIAPLVQRFIREILTGQLGHVPWGDTCDPFHEQVRKAGIPRNPAATKLHTGLRVSRKLGVECALKIAGLLGIPAGQHCDHTTATAVLQYRPYDRISMAKALTPNSG
ncbi:MAG: hypothetical protein ABJF23_34000, partial [Bryobacteraceae bacterium]